MGRHCYLSILPSYHSRSWYIRPNLDLSHVKPCKSSTYPLPSRTMDDDTNTTRELVSADTERFIHLARWLSGSIASQD